MQGYYLSSDCSACLLIEAVLLHRYDFNDGTAGDSVGGCAYEATVAGGAVVEGGQVNMAAFGIAGGYVNIPSTVFGDYADSAVSIEVWFSASFNSGWARVFEFGLSNDDFILLARDGGDGHLQLQYFDTPYLFNDLVNVYAVLTMSAGSPAELYINSSRVATSTAVVDPIPTPAVFFIGKSLYYGDVGFNGSVNEFRVWGGILSQANITQHYQEGPSKFPAQFNFFS